MTSPIKNHYPVIITSHVKECKTFYESYFQFHAVFEEEWYIQLINDVGVELGFMLPNLKNQPAFLQDPFCGKGMIITLEVENCAQEYERLQKEDIKILLEYTEESWGQKHFIIADPAGLLLDVVGKTNPEDY